MKAQKNSVLRWGLIQDHCCQLIVKTFEWIKVPQSKGSTKGVITRKSFLLEERSQSIEAKSVSLTSKGPGRLVWEKEVVGMTMQKIIENFKDYDEKRIVGVATWIWEESTRSGSANFFL